jgi:hypothetical protein
VELRTAIICSNCQQPIVSGEGCGFVCFKIPGEEGYRFFHRRFRSADCWESYIRLSQYTEAQSKGSLPVPARA